MKNYVPPIFAMFTIPAIQWTIADFQLGLAWFLQTVIGVLTITYLIKQIRKKDPDHLKEWDKNRKK